MDTVNYAYRPPVSPDAEFRELTHHGRYCVETHHNFVLGFLQYLASDYDMVFKLSQFEAYIEARMAHANCYEYSEMFVDQVICELQLGQVWRGSHYDI